MSEVSFNDDPLASRVTRIFVLVQIAGMVIVVGLSILGRFFLALTISFLTLFSFVAVLGWLYLRYRDTRIVHDKRELERLVRKFQKGTETEGKIIEASIQEREVLAQAETDEIHTVLTAAQASHLETGLAAASLAEAVIPEIGPELKEQLAGYGVTSAAQVTEEIAELPEIDKAKRQALLDWRRSIVKSLENAKPETLPNEQLESIHQKYEDLHEKNDAAERQARASKLMLEYELNSFKPRMGQLASLTFLNYLSNSLASRGVVATLIAFILVLAQVVSLLSATAASFLASFASVTSTTTPSSAATIAPPPTVTPASSPTFAPSASATAVSLPTPAQIPTHTPLATFTALVVLQPSDTPYIPISGLETQGNCDASYPGVCIPPPPPDLDCGEIPYRRFQVLPPDPHHFDRDGDGIGCES